MGTSHDAFFMALPESSVRLRLQAFETPWGITDEVLCYWDGILFGQMMWSEEVKFANLLPKLDRQREYSWPSAEAFASAITGILDEFPDLEVWCERDCDHYPVMNINTVDELLSQLQLVFSYCLGDRLECPSIAYCPSPVRANLVINRTR